ncbi:hypothetical protein CHH49_04010 [Terribacillus saccharophilus]|uniref:MrcB family domain-containing protein n=1 Tax=Terribacillus saccharophilus TaxID=361277 RepID=UPI000BA54A07|nr:DUF3578 domain-containing protein [Terribacillus saccharophilus]PAF22759.1 hypothetical protein CHH49_04010 [Terribacillus saccharophilus]
MNLLFSKKEYEDLYRYKFEANGNLRERVDKSNPGHRYFVNEIPRLLFSKLKDTDLDVDKLEVKASVGEGRLSEVFWVAFLNEDYVPKNKSNKLSTRNGIYIVLLLDRNLEFAYLSIGNGTENLSPKELEKLSKNQMKIIENEPLDDIELNTNFDFYLGKSTRPKKYVKGTVGYKRFDVRNIEVNQLINYVIKLHKLLDLIVLEKGIEELEVQETNEKKRRYTTISVEKHAALLETRNKRQKIVGDIAEEFVYQQELNRLSHLSDLQDKVEWCSKTTDGLGYDIKSFFEDGREKFIEVKGTALNTNEITYYLSLREKIVADKKGDQYALVLVSNAAEDKEPQIITEVINPANALFNDLEAIQFRGKFNV